MEFKLKNPSLYGGALVAAGSLTVIQAFIITGVVGFMTFPVALASCLGSLLIIGTLIMAYYLGVELVELPMVRISPWDMQASLMRASGQLIPEHPRLTSGGLLYGALLIEETGETYEAIAAALRRYLASDQARTDAFSGKITHPDLAGICHEFLTMSRICQQYSTAIRQMIPTAGNVSFDLLQEEAIPILDGTTDVTVVNCGLAESFGLPGKAAYDEVANSNLSKRNPATGLIDKTPDGKWIKGVNYQSPNLGAVLEIHLNQKACDGLHQ